MVIQRFLVLWRHSFIVIQWYLVLLFHGKRMTLKFKPVGEIVVVLRAFFSNERRGGLNYAREFGTKF